jgi:hypothetical protein
LIGAVVELYNVSVILDPDPEPVAGVIPLTSARVQEYVGAGLAPLVMVYVFDIPWHHVAVAELVMIFTGNIVTFPEVPVFPVPEVAVNVCTPAVPLNTNSPVRLATPFTKSEA